MGGDNSTAMSTTTMAMITQTHQASMFVPPEEFRDPADESGICGTVPRIVGSGTIVAITIRISGRNE